MARTDLAGVDARAPARSAAASRTWPSSRLPPIGCSSAAAARRAGASSRSPARSASTPTAARITSFASRDGQYRLYACDVCERYVKAYDARRASRPVMPVVDGVATLPLDAAAIQKGYQIGARATASLCCWSFTKRSAVFCENQLKRWRVSQKRPGFDVRAEHDDRDLVALRHAEQASRGSGRPSR